MKGVRELIKNLGTMVDKASWKPVFFNLTKDGDPEKLYKLINETPGISVHDEIENQLDELLKSLFPVKKLKGEALKSAVKEHIGETPLEEYGNWVYYPWSKRVVHILDEEEYIFARTSRNMYKITPDEQAELRKKKIGVIGLSVGQSVSLTLAMERICGEIRLTDFDILELTNLNRIRTGIHTIGLKKVYAVAREIAEIDPYIKVSCFPEGLNESNMDSFFLENGKLDLLIEESDGFDIKVLSRYKAKELKIPVLMEASDRCMVDVERFDLEPNRPILHGLINHLDPAMLKTLKTNEEKIPYMLDVLGIDSMSTRIKASMLEIDQTITTWPQLASAVIMGGGVTADVARRMLLGSFTDSGRYWVDVEELIGNKVEGESRKLSGEVEGLEMPPMPSPLNIETIQNEINSLNLDKPNNLISCEECEKLIEIASTAPSAGNYQHWKWYFDNERIFLFHDRGVSYNWSDSDYFAADLGLGTASQTFILGAESLNIPIEYFNTYKKDGVLAAYFEKSSKTIEETIINGNKLNQGIELRCSNRKIGSKAKIESSFLNSLKEFTSNFSNKHSLKFFEEKSKIEIIADLLGESEKIRFIDPRGHSEVFEKEIRWNNKEAEESKDGLDIETLELKFLDYVGMKVASNPNVVSLLNKWDKGDGFKKTSGDATKSSSAIGLLITDQIDSTNLFESGRLVQNIWIASNMSNIALHPISAPLFFTHRLNTPKNFYTQEQIKKFENIRDRLNKVLDLCNNEKGIFMFRLHLSNPPSKRSLRKSINQILIKK